MKAVLAVFTALICSNEARIGTFWHVTDFHLDVNYTTEGDTASMCWKNKSPARNNRNGRPGVYGDYLCDAPIQLVLSAVDAMRKIHSNPDFIMWTGDDTAHVEDKYFSTATVVEIVKTLTDTLNGTFPNIPFLPVLGNHDYYPKNQLPPGKSSLQGQVAELWKGWLDRLDADKAFKSFNSSGRYVADIKGTKVSVMALNTLIWYKSNNSTALNKTSDDPDHQFAWADEQLTALAKNGRKVYLMGHIPPGNFERYQQKTEGFHWYQERYNQRFIKLIQDHYEVIEAQFFAHHHTDSFRLFFKDDRRDGKAQAISYQLLAPGVTPWKSTLSEETGANNPGIRLVSYDTETGKLTEVTTYYLDLRDANENEPEWKFEYNFTTYYGLKNISALSLFDLNNRMTNDRKLFDRYYVANTVKYEDASACTPSCQKLHRCSIAEVDYTRFRACNATSKLVPWSLFLFLIVGSQCLRSLL